MTPVGLYTLNVGHGLCHIIVLPRRRAIVIDGGPASQKKVPSTFLSRRVDVIVAYIATHNDRDHIGAAEQFLKGPKYSTRQSLQAIWALVDRDRRQRIKLLKDAKERYSEGSIGNFYLSHLDNRPKLKPKKIFFDRETGCRVELLYPCELDSLAAVADLGYHVSPNRVSSIVRVSLGTSATLVTGDADVRSFKHVHDYGFELEADAIIVPHHGGKIPGGNRHFAWTDVIDMVKPKLAVVSAGAHTVVQETTVQPLVDRGAHVVCTQITNKCHPKPDKFLPMIQPRKIQRLEAGCTSGTGCFNDICLEMTATGVSIPGIGSHRSAIETHVQPEGEPLCCRRP